MHTDRTVDPTPEQIALIAAYPDNAPFVMVNLLKFTRPDGAGRYWQDYAPAVTPLMEAAGGVTVYKGSVRHLIIGAAPNDWDAVWLVRWQAKSQFLSMMNHPDFPATQAIRVSALERMTLMLSAEEPTNL
ncbi:MAG TPA: hypothetical protein PKA66_12875 [Gemmatimonadales bacterium]|nr:hypothetical protein [Gemmatimonadales bacterium]